MSGGPGRRDAPEPPGMLARWWSAVRQLPMWARVLLVLGLLWAVAIVALLATGPPRNPAQVAQDDPTSATAASPVDEPSPRPGPSPTPAPSPAPSPDEGGPDGGTGATPGQRLEVHFLDVGQADATLLRAPDATVLIDTGDWQRSDVVPHLRARGVASLDVVVVTHPHADHIGQFDQVMDAIDVAEVWWSGAPHTTATFDRALDALEASDAAYEEARAGDTTEVGSLRFEFVNPPPTADFRDLHDSTLAFRVSYGEVRFLFTGDAEEPTESRMVRSHRDLLDADIYQAGHHGSSTSTSAGFLEAVSPEVAVYSAGQDNRYGHPHDEVVDRLERAGADVYGTPASGSIVVTTDGTTWEVTPARH